MRYRVTAVACALVLMGGLVTAAYRHGEAAADGGPALPVLGGPAGELPAEIGVVGEVYEELRRHAVSTPDEAELVRGAIEGMLETLDDNYSVYYDTQAWGELNAMLDGRFSGVGLLLEEDAQGPQVVRVLPDTPAEAAGVEVGERIVEVDGRDVRGEPIELVTGLVKGEAGTTVRIGFDGGPAGARVLEIVRAELDLPTVDARLEDDATGMLELYGFNDVASTQLRNAIEQLEAEGARGLVLDLRGNPGGLLEQAVEVTNLFLTGDEVVSVVEADGRTRRLRAEEPVATELPLVVLVDEGTASAAEIVAAALQDLGRARLVGTQTFGKGTVQSLRRLSDGSGLKFTTAEYFTADGDSIEGVGVTPDVVESDREAQMAAARAELRALLAVR